MMRALYSGVAGLKTHQTRMDVIGNNIANVNTVGFKSSAANFADTFYQTVSGATGPNADMGTAGVNAKQIGLGSQVAAIQVNITEQGGYSTTNRALDVAINGESFMIVSSNGETRFTKSGAMNVDEAGNLYCTTNGATIMGWTADANGDIVKNNAQPLKVMGPDNMYYKPETTKSVVMTGNIDPNDPDVNVTYGTYDASGSFTPVTTAASGTTLVPGSGGEVMTFSFYDNIGELYTVKLRVAKNPMKIAGTPGTSGSAETPAQVQYDVWVEDVLNSDSKSIFSKLDTTTGRYVPTGASFSWGGKGVTDGKATDVITVSGATARDATGASVDELTGEVKIRPDATNNLKSIFFNNTNGTFKATSERSETTKSPSTENSINFYVYSLGEKDGSGATIEDGSTSFSPLVDSSGEGGVNVFFDSLSQYSQGGTSKLSYQRGDKNNKGAGYPAGNMTGISVDKEGKVWGSYNNGAKKCLAQLAVATFSNPSGLEEVGNSLFAASLNSGTFNGVGEEILLTGSFTVGALEMSNVDLANEFTTMIITQRGFQANSRIITTSDSLLEELVNLKR